MVVDFHTHTTESDGVLSPEALVESARRAGIDYLSVTDHDTTAAFERDPSPFAPIAGRVIVGMEVSTHSAGRDIHVLAYRVPLGGCPLREAIGDREASRWRRIRQITEALGRCGIQISDDDVRRQARGRIANRAHVARALVERSAARDVPDAFARYLGVGAPAYVPSTSLTPSAAIRAIRESGAIPVLAHPSRADAAREIPALAAAGLAGLEVYYAGHDPNETEHYRKLAREFGLVMSAGSDFHEPTQDRLAPGCDVDRSEIAPFLELIL